MAIQRDTQDRAFNTGIDIQGFTGWIGNVQNQTATGILDLQGWGYADESGLSLVTDNNLPCIRLVDDTSSINPRFFGGYLQDYLQELFDNGGEVQWVVRCTDSPTGSLSDAAGAFTWGWTNETDPRAVNHYAFPNNNTSTYFLKGGSDYNLGVDGEVEFTVINAHNSVPSGSNYGVFLGDASNAQDFIGYNSAANIVVFINNTLYTHNTWTLDTTRARNTVRIRRSDADNRIYCWINETLQADVTTTNPYDLSINAIGYSLRDTTYLDDGASIIDLTITPTVGGTSYQYGLTTTGQTHTDELGSGDSFTIQNYNASNWTTAGSEGRFICQLGHNRIDTQAFVVNDNDGQGTDVFFSKNDATPMQVTMALEPSPDGLEWGNMTIFVDGVPQSTMTPASWINGGGTPNNSLAIQSGSTSGGGRDFYTHACQIQAFTDSRTYPLVPQAWEINTIGEIIGRTPVNVTIPTEVDTIDDGVNISINILDNTPITITCETGTFLNNGTDTFVVNPSATEDVVTADIYKIGAGTYQVFETHRG